jgi:N-acyl-phosphatidylethanolamine-hydrolysing phospholipase D
VQVTWVGHSTFLLQLEGLTLLTDPVFSQRCSPVQWMGPKRVVPPAFDISHPDLPKVDAVLLSHNHYDHLDKASVLQLNARFGERLRWWVAHLAVCGAGWCWGADCTGQGPHAQRAACCSTAGIAS